MRFEVKDPDGGPHEIELPGSLVVLGREPTCDLVLHDVKCSRHHAVLETGPDGLVVRDTGSANGIFVNGQRVERAGLKPGDVLQLGDTLIKVLPGEDDVPGTIVMGPADQPSEAATIVPGIPRPGAPAKADALPPPAPPLPAGDEGGRHPSRPLTVSVLAALWLMSVPVYGLGGALFGMRGQGLAAGLAATTGLLLAALSGVMAWGLWSLRPWARLAQVAVAVAGLVVCPFTLASVVVLVYALGPVGKAAFDPARTVEPAVASPETVFTFALLGTVLLGAFVTAVGLLLPFTSRAAGS